MDDDDDAFDVALAQRHHRMRYVRAPRADPDDEHSYGAAARTKPAQRAPAPRHGAPPPLRQPPASEHEPAATPSTQLKQEAQPPPSSDCQAEEDRPLSLEDQPLTTDPQQSLRLQGMVLIGLVLAMLLLVMAMARQASTPVSGASSSASSSSSSSSAAATKALPPAMLSTSLAQKPSGALAFGSRDGWREASPPPWPPWRSPPPLPPSPSPPSPCPTPPPPQHPLPSPPLPSPPPLHPPYPSFPLPRPPPNPPNPPPPPPRDCITCGNFPLPTSDQALDAEKCLSLLSDRSGKMWAMWAANGWERRAKGQPSCFEQGAPPFSFEAVLRQERCDRNWYEGVLASIPSYPSPSAPALLGFDNTIYAYCSAQILKEEGPFYGDHGEMARRCVQASHNILRTMGTSEGAWNMCLNLHWIGCAIQGALPGQRGKPQQDAAAGVVGGKMMFSIKPSSLSLYGFEHPSEGCFSGPNGQCGPKTYAVSDVYYAEICVLSTVCRNGEQLFRLGVGELFECEFDPAKFLGLRTMLMGG